MTREANVLFRIGTARALERAVNPSGDASAAILVMESGALWPGPMLDWAPNVTVVSHGPRGTADALVRRVRRAARACALRAQAVGGVLVSFADTLTVPSDNFRSDLVKGLGALVPEIGCRRLILAAYHVHRLEFEDLVILARSTPFCNTERIELFFHPAGRSTAPRARIC